MWHIGGLCVHVCARGRHSNKRKEARKNSQTVLDDEVQNEALGEDRDYMENLLLQSAETSTSQPGLEFWREETAQSSMLAFLGLAEAKQEDSEEMSQGE